jgi:hypothetical protein
VGSLSVGLSWSRGFAVPPFAAFRKIFQGFPFSADMYAICFPSGDQRGSAETDTGRRCACSSFLSDRRPIFASPKSKIGEHHGVLST